MFPLVVEPLKVYPGAPTGENAEIPSHLLRCHEAAATKGTWMLDRGSDRRALFGPLVRQGVAFVVRQRGDRTARATDGRDIPVDAPVAEPTCPRPRRWPHGGVSVTVEVRLPEVADEPVLLVIGWRVPGSEHPLVLLVSPHAGRPGRTGTWFVRAYHTRWGVEDATRGIKQRFNVGQFLVRSWMAIRRSLWLVAWAFGWLNLWGGDSFERLRDARIKHPRRLKKTVTYLSDWIATMLRLLLHTHPKLRYHTG